MLKKNFITYKPVISLVFSKLSIFLYLTDEMRCCLLNMKAHVTIILVRHGCCSSYAMFIHSATDIYDTYVI